jgi:hypothetical protein
MSDFSVALKRAVRNIFPCTKQLFCFFHLKRNIDKNKIKYFGTLNKQDYENIKNDIYTLSICPDENTFMCGISLFSKKYSKYKEFLLYFHENYVDKNNSWYLGCSPPYIGNTNNTNESFNSIIKKVVTNRKLLPISQFMEKLFSFINYYDIWTKFSLESINFQNNKQSKLVLKYADYRKIIYNNYITYIHPKIYEKTKENVEELVKIKIHEIKEFDIFSAFLKINRTQYDKNKSDSCSCRYFNAYFTCAHYLRTKIDQGIYFLITGLIDIPSEKMKFLKKTLKRNTTTALSKIEEKPKHKKRSKKN